jgi:hypothetical protein
MYFTCNRTSSILLTKKRFGIIANKDTLKIKMIFFSFDVVDLP